MDFRSVGANLDRIRAKVRAKARARLRVRYRARVANERLINWQSSEKLGICSNGFAPCMWYVVCVALSLLLLLLPCQRLELNRSTSVRQI